MKNVIIGGKINRIIIELREEEVLDGQKWDTFLEFCTFQAALLHPDSFFLICKTAIIPRFQSVMSLMDFQRPSTRVGRKEVSDGGGTWARQSSFLAVAPLHLNKAAGCETSLLCPPVAAAVKHSLPSSSVCA